MLSSKHLTPILLSLFFFILYSNHTIYRHLSFKSHAFDLGINVNTTYLYSQHLLPYSSLKHMLHPADHFGFILALLAPIYAVFPDPITLLIIQAGFVSFSAIFIYLIAQNKLQNNLFSFLITLAFLAYPGIQSAIDFDFHLATISILPLTLILYSWYFKKWRLYWVVLAFSLIFKDDIPLFIFGLGIYQIFAGERKTGFATSIFGLVSFYIIKFILMPFFWQGASEFYISSSVLPLSNPLEIPILLYYRPNLLTDIIFNSPIKLHTLDYIYRSFAFLPLLSPLNWTTSFFHIFLRFSSIQPHFWGTAFHYNANIAPFLAVSSILAVDKFRLTNKAFPLLLIFFLSTGGLSGSLSPQSIIWNSINLPAQNLKKFSYIVKSLKTIPKDAIVSAQSPLVPHLSNREKIYLFPEVYDAQYVVLDSSLSHYPLNYPEFTKKLDAFKKSKSWKLDLQTKTLYIFKRV
ncbi:DUF2079 domain-containing protein [Candidatus Daviesbacteria bacterium]|nr:DUF2079 domain-containing protein [Candidatus Daviesbacteria bacterium]